MFQRLVPDVAQPTIFALSSAPGRAGVSVVRISGPQAHCVAECLAGRRFTPRMATRAMLRDPKDGSLIDDALVATFAGPASFTGEDVAEFHVHGGPALVRRLLEVLAAQPECQPAEAGAFTRRAFEAGKLDLTRVEAIADLIDAETEAQHRQAVGQLDGRLFRAAEAWRSQLVDARAFMEAALDFSDEADVADGAITEAMRRAEAVRSAMSEELAGEHRGEILRDGFRVVLAGRPNAGKSSLLNALAGRDAAIVSAEPGTTRDIVEVRLDLGGYPVVVQDTAGLRNDAGAVEKEGMRRAERAMTEAQAVLWLSPRDEPWAPGVDLIQRLGSRLTVVETKTDLTVGESEHVAGATLQISTPTGVGINDLIAHLRDAASSFFTTAEAPLVTAPRHREALQATADAITAALAAPIDWPEVKAEELRRASDALARVVGRVDVEDVLDRLFAGFCIGK